MPVVVLIGIIVLAFIFFPFILIAGVNFVLDGSGFGQYMLAYNLSTWFGALLIGMALRGEYNSK